MIFVTVSIMFDGPLREWIRKAYDMSVWLAPVLCIASHSTVAAELEYPPEFEEFTRQRIEKVDVEAAAQFSASRATYQHTCLETDPHFQTSSTISKYEAAEMNAEERKQYVQSMLMKYQSHTSAYETMGDEGKKEFCVRIGRSLARYAYAFIRRNPKLFNRRGPAP